MADFFARTEWKLERLCKIKDRNLSFWVYELVSWWVGELMSWWVGELMRWWVGEFLSFWVFELMSWLVDELMSLWVYELMSWWVGELMSWWVGELVSWCVRELLGFHEFIRQWVDLPCTSYMGGVLILCWHHRDNRLLSIYWNIISQDAFNECTSW